MQKHFRSKIHLENEKLNEMIIPKWLFKEEEARIKKQQKKVYNLKTLQQIARENIKFFDEVLDKEIAKKMIDPYYFMDEISKTGFKINLGSPNVNHANSAIIIEPNLQDFGIETRYFNKILKESSIIYAILINHYNINYHTFFSASFSQMNEEDQRSDEIELTSNLNIILNLTETDNNIIDAESQLEHQNQIHDAKKRDGYLIKFLQ